MGPRQFLLALRARRAAFALTLGAVLLAALVTSLLLPKSYRATVSLLVDSKDQQSLGEPLRQMLLPQERLGFLQTQADILTSRKVAVRVVRDLKLLERPDVLASLGVPGSNLHRDEERLAELLQKRLKTDTSQSSVLQASIASGDPNSSALLANGFAKAYAETLLELRVAPTREAAAWFDEQLKGLLRTVEEAQARLTDYYRKHAITPGDARYAPDVDGAHQLPAELRDGADTSGPLLGDASTDSLPQFAHSPFIQQLQTEILHAEEKLQELSTQYGENHPSYQRQVSQIHTLRARLRVETARILGIPASGTQSAEVQGADLRHALERQRARQLDQMEKRGELAVLRRNVETAEKAYDTAMQRYLVSQVDSRAQTASGEVLSEAVPPTSAYRPRITLNMALALVSGLALAGVVVFLLENRDRRVRSAEDLVFAVRLPLLAVIGDRNVAPQLLVGPPITHVKALPGPALVGGE